MARGDKADLFFRKLRTAGLSKPAVETLATRLDALEAADSAASSASGAAAPVAFVRTANVTDAWGDFSNRGFDYVLAADGTQFSDVFDDDNFTWAGPGGLRSGSTVTLKRDGLLLVSLQAASLVPGTADDAMIFAYITDADDTSDPIWSALGASALIATSKMVQPVYTFQVPVRAGQVIQFAAGADGADTSTTVVNGPMAMTLTYLSGAGPQGTPTIHDYTADHTVTSIDVSGVVRVAHGTVAATVTLPEDSAIPVGATLEVLRYGAAGVALAAGAGVTIHNRQAGLTIAHRYGTATAQKMSATEWLVDGDLIAP